MTRLRVPGILQVLWVCGSGHPQPETPVSHVLLDTAHFPTSDFHPFIFSQWLWLLASLNKLLGRASDISRSFISRESGLDATARGNPCCLPK